MPKRADGFAVNNLLLYEPDLFLADSDNSTGYSRYSASAGDVSISALLDLGTSPAAVKRCRAVVSYASLLVSQWSYSQDGVTWTGSFGPDTPPAEHPCNYQAVSLLTTLMTPVTARYWRLSVQDATSECFSTQAGIMELSVEDAGGTTLAEPMTLYVGIQSIAGDRAVVSAREEGVTISGQSDRVRSTGQSDGVATSGKGEGASGTGGKG